MQVPPGMDDMPESDRRAAAAIARAQAGLGRGSKAPPGVPGAGSSSVHAAPQGASVSGRRHRQRKAKARELGSDARSIAGYSTRLPLEVPVTMTGRNAGEQEGHTPGNGLRNAVTLRGAREKASQFGGTAGGDRSHAVFASQMREGFYRPDDALEERSGRRQAPVRAPAGVGPSDRSVPSDATPSYAYRHAASDAGSSVYDRLTNPGGYTGTHRHRFGRDGRGKGVRGRDDTSVDY